MVTKNFKMVFDFNARLSGSEQVVIDIYMFGRLFGRRYISTEDDFIIILDDEDFVKGIEELDVDLKGPPIPVVFKSQFL